MPSCPPGPTAAERLPEPPARPPARPDPRSAPRPSALDEALDALLRAPPAGAARLAQRQHPFTTAALQDRLAERILAGALRPAQVDCLPLLARLLGVGAHRPALEALLFDPAAPPDRRGMALAALFHEPDGAALLDRLGPAARVRLSDPWVRPLVRLAAFDPDAQAAVADLIRTTPAPWRDAMLARIETHRRRFKTSAVDTYARAVVSPSLAPQWPTLFSFLLADGPPRPRPR